jgi:hypothetical protein
MINKGNGIISEKAEEGEAMKADDPTVAHDGVEVLEAGQASADGRFTDVQEQGAVVNREVVGAAGALEAGGD